MLKVVAEIWKDAGYTVLGGALAGKAAEGLQNGAHIQSRTLASWQYRWDVGKDQFDSKTIFVLDEAGLVASKQMAAFLQAVKNAGAKSCWLVMQSSCSRSRRGRIQSNCG